MDGGRIPRGRGDGAGPRARSRSFSPPTCARRSSGKSGTNGRGPPSSLPAVQPHGWWYYFPVAFALRRRSPPPALARLARVGLLRIIRQARTAVPLSASPLRIYTGFVMLGRLDIGVRYYLPAFPLPVVAGGALLGPSADSKRARRRGLAPPSPCLAWVGVEAVRAYPNTLPYMTSSRRAARMVITFRTRTSRGETTCASGPSTCERAADARARGHLGGYATLASTASKPRPHRARHGLKTPEDALRRIGASFLQRLDRGRARFAGAGSRRGRVNVLRRLPSAQAEPSSAARSTFSANTSENRREGVEDRKTRLRSSAVFAGRAGG